MSETTGILGPCDECGAASLDLRPLYIWPDDPDATERELCYLCPGCEGDYAAADAWAADLWREMIEHHTALEAPHA